MKRWRSLAVLVLIWIAAGIAPCAANECEPQVGSSVSALLDLASRCPSRVRIEDLLAVQGETVVPELVEAFHSTPGLRPEAVRMLARTGPAGLEAFGQLGTEGVMALAEAGLAEADSHRMLSALGPKLLPTLADMVKEPRRLPSLFAARALAGMGPVALDALLECLESSPGSTARNLCAWGAVDIDEGRTLGVILQRLRAPDLDEAERLSLGAVLARIDDQAALDAVVAILKDGSTSRAGRWSLAQALKATGRHDAVEAANRFGPTGRQGSGNPESPLGTIVAGLLIVGVVVTFVTAKGNLRLGQRARLVAGATVVVYLAATVAQLGWSLVAAMGPLGLESVPLWMDVVYAGVLLLASSLGVAVVKGPNLPWRCAPVMGIGATTGFLVGFRLDLSVNWYLDRIVSNLLGFWYSPLVLGAVLAFALAASYFCGSADRRADTP
jgi:hypothetical protein